MYKYLFIHSLNLPFHLPLGPITYPKKKKSFIHISLLACVTREKEEKEKDIGERERNRNRTTPLCLLANLLACDNTSGSLLIERGIGERKLMWREGERGHAYLRTLDILVHTYIYSFLLASWHVPTPCYSKEK